MSSSKYTLQARSTGGGGDGTVYIWQDIAPVTTNFPGPGTPDELAILALPSDGASDWRAAEVTPAFQTTAGSPVIGTGGTVALQYRLSGNAYDLRFALHFGTGVNLGSGSLKIPMPNAVRTPNTGALPVFGSTPTIEVICTTLISSVRGGSVVPGDVVSGFVKPLAPSGFTAGDTVMYSIFGLPLDRL